MKITYRIVWLLCFIAISHLGYGQKYEREIRCSDTLTVYLDNRPKTQVTQKSNATSTNRPYRIVECEKRSPFGLRLDIGVSKYYYGPMTKTWIDNHGGPNFGIGIAIGGFTLGARFKPWTLNPLQELEFDGVILPTNAKVNNIKVDYYAAFSIDLPALVSLEPYLGFNRSQFIVINEDEIKQTYSLPQVGGILAGMTINKYFAFERHQYFAVFASGGFANTDFSEVHRELDKGYWEWSVGVSYKGFLIKRFTKRAGS